MDKKCKEESHTLETTLCLKLLYPEEIEKGGAILKVNNHVTVQIAVNLLLHKLVGRPAVGHDLA
ncbi:predicted protein [Uncinocarpus reesii 1704]|uniref:Uncharacterized protein n=1 Tax=Uncinocarpus reesii (strain UAMH 1704) TaxID=336963 RepID=C4JMN6_UNCRE|nr:uncharacterized protein UREG_04094 [Uncinocarpus reesii 1704]EEP79248.1 predicted protein [Uncinocarpus reesii 1704]